MLLSLETVLARAGLRVGAQRFLGLVEEAAHRLAPAHPDPADYFSAEQQDTLAAVGLDLSPAHAGDSAARARTVAAQAVLADSSLTVAEAAETLGVDPSRVRHRLARGRLTGWKDQGGWRLPAWQFAGSGVLPGLEVLLAALPGDQPAMVVAAFAGTPQQDLPLNEHPATPRQWLLAGGDPEQVARLARMLGTAL